MSAVVCQNDIAHLFLTFFFFTQLPGFKDPAVDGFESIVRKGENSCAYDISTLPLTHSKSLHRVYAEPRILKNQQLPKLNRAVPYDSCFQKDKYESFKHSRTNACKLHVIT